MILKVRPVLRCVVVCLISMIAGCSNSDLATVSGKVKVADAVPPMGSRVVAQPTNGGKAVYGTTDKDGGFTLSAGGENIEILPGEYQIAIMENLGRGDIDQRAVRKIASKYSQPATSGLVVKVEAGEHKEVEFVLDPQ